jgi:hypothetical protein
MGANIEKIEERSFKEWFGNWFDDEDITEMAEIGPEHFGPFIYYSDTSMLYERFGGEIWDLVDEAAGSFYGFTGLGLMALREKDICSPAGFECHMVWTAASYLAFEHVQREEKEHDNNEKGGQ